MLKAWRGWEIQVPAKNCNFIKVSLHICMDDQQQENELTPKEPAVAYNTPASGSIRFFSSHKGQEEEMVNYWASITPAERLRHLHEMIIASYGLTEEMLQHPKLTNKITFIYSGGKQ